MTGAIYLDAGSSMPVLPEARAAVEAALDVVGDPIQIHAPGRAARALLEDGREAVAAAIGAQPDEIVFTSGGTEATALAVAGTVRAGATAPGAVVIGAIEHPAVRAAAGAIGGVTVREVPVDPDGRVDLDRFAALVRMPGTVLASIQHANHEIGTIQQVAQAARLAREARVRFHTDARATAGHVPVDAAALGADLVSLAAHTFGGPPGVGALYVRRGTTLAASPSGDDRERKRRAGMENLPDIAGLGAALRASVRSLADRAATNWALTSALRHRLAAVPGITVHGHPTQRVPHLVAFSVAGVDPATLAMALDDHGFAIGAGAVATGRPEDPSPVLDRLGFPRTTSFRVGLGEDASRADLDALIDVLAGTVARLRTIDVSSREALARLSPPEER